MNVVILGRKIALIINATQTGDICSIRKLMLVGYCCLSTEIDGPWAEKYCSRGSKLAQHRLRSIMVIYIAN
jgi:hypothetical protein